MWYYIIVYLAETPHDNGLQNKTKSQIGDRKNNKKVR